LRKISTALKVAGVIRERSGSLGGFKLAKSVDDISVFDVVCIFEYSMNIVRCLGTDCFCSMNAADHCLIREFYVKLQHKIHEIMSMKISEFLKS
jgi:Rrf2 family protein